MREEAKAVADLLIPVVKGWSTEIGSEAAALGVQVHGGMGYIEETGAAQFMRDRERLNRLQEAGWRVVFVTAGDLRRPRDLVARIAAALAR